MQEELRAWDHLFGPLGMGPLPDRVDFVCCAQFVVDRDTIRRHEAPWQHSASCSMTPEPACIAKKVSLGGRTSAADRLQAAESLTCVLCTGGPSRSGRRWWTLCVTTM